MAKISTEDKYSFLKEVRDRKEILFSKQTATVTNEMKQKCWTEVFDWCAENGMPFVVAARAQTKVQPWKYIRDSVYGNYCQQLKVGSCLC